MKLNCKRTRRQPCTCSENVKTTVKSAQPRPRSSVRLYTPYHDKLRHVTQFGLGNFVPPSFISPVPGDLLEFDRKLYSHWAVYIGDGQQVIHVSGRTSDISSKDVQVRLSTLAEVAKDSLVRINNKTVPAKDRKLKALEPRKIVANARKCLGKTVLYDMLTSNAEHYVTLWRYGKAWSDQAETAIAVMKPHKTRSSSCTSSSSSSEDDLTRNSSTDSITSMGSEESMRRKCGRQKSVGSPTSAPTSPSHSLLSDKDASFQMSLLAGLTAIFNSGKPSTSKSAPLRSQSSPEGRIEQ